MQNLPSFFTAIDDSEPTGAFQKAQKIKNVPGNWGIKLNLDLIAQDINIISRISDLTGKGVFADLKMMNGKRTMRVLVKSVADRGAVMINAYALADRLLKGAVEEANERGLTVLGVTITTHYDEEYCKKVYGRSLPDTVAFLAQMALDNGCHGYILPGTTLDAVAHLGGLKFNPAVRPTWYEDKKTNDQEQIMAPAEAFKKGSDIVSCGSPVFKSPDPAEALAKILAEIESVIQ